MANYKWKGVDGQGIAQAGTMEAPDADAVRAALKRQNIEAQNVSRDFGKLEFNIPGLTDRVSEREVVVFTRMFSTMIDAGLPLVQCLEILSSQAENATMQKALGDIRKNVEGGATFADSLRRHPRIFDELYCNMVEAGETGGILDTILNRLAAYMEKSITLKAQVKSAMIYPVVVFTLACLIVAGLMIYVIPVFAEVFVQLGSTLPLPTAIVLAISKFMAANWYLILAGMVGIAFIYRTIYKTEKGQLYIDGIKLKLPVFGLLLRKVAVAKFTRTLSTLLASGVPILDGLEITAKTAGNKVIEEAVLKTRVSIAEGRTIAEPLGETEVFPAMVVQMIGVGESTGALDTMLEKIADFYDEEVDITVGNLQQALEPMIMVVLGVLIGGIVIAMYMPMFALIGELA
jgi:type IV pilus assembly protein PilC